MPATAALPAPRSARVPAGPARRERARQTLVRGVFLLFALGIVEGVLRKWVAPQLGAVLFFIRDPLLLALYALATWHRLWPRRSIGLRVAWTLAALGVLWFVLQAATGGASDLRLLLGAYGWRNYFLYVPLAFLVGHVFQPADVQRLVRAVLWLALPVAVLVVLQFFAPPDAALNVGSASDEAYQFRGATQNAERTRPMGPFASVAGQNQFVGVAAALLLAGLIAPPRQRPGPLLLAAAGAGVFTCLALGGSRGAVLQAGLSLAAALAVGGVARRGAVKARALLLPAAVAVLALLAYPVVFPDGHAAFSERWNTADRAEQQTFPGAGILGRALYGLVDFVDLFDRVPLLGWGLGFGGNASTTLGATVDGVRPGLLAETDYARHMVDLGPVFGLGYLGFRVALVAWLAVQALRATRRRGDPLPLLLFSYVGSVVGSGQITGQGTINLFGWLFAGLLIAQCRAGGFRHP